MKVTKIKHSGFLVELEKKVLIFDWFQGALPDFDRGKPVYVFVSHSHGDHYSPVIWNLRQICKDVFYILYEETDKEREVQLRVVPHQTYFRKDMEIRTLLSTDEGVAFWIRTEGKVLFHAGDLNIWYWEEDPQIENDWQVATYQKEILSLRKERIDLAFLPLDPRLGQHGPDGILFFLDHVAVDQVITMHDWERYEEVEQYLETTRLRDYRDKIDVRRDFTGNL